MKKGIVLSAAFLFTLCLANNASAKSLVSGDLATGTITINGKTPENIDEAYIAGFLLEDSYGYEKCFSPKNDSFFTFAYGDYMTDEFGNRTCYPENEVTVKYTNTPPRVIDKSAVDDALKKINDYSKPFIVDDLQFIDYFLYGYSLGGMPVETAVQAPNFSKAYKELTSGKNFRVKILNVAGYGGFTFWTGTGGFGVLSYKDYIFDYVSVSAPTHQIIYVPTSTPDNTEARIEAATKKINAYYNKTKHSDGFSITYDRQLDELYSDVTAEELLQPILYDDPNISINNKDAYILKYQNKTIPILIQESDGYNKQSDFISIDIGHGISVSSQNHEMPYDTYIDTNEIDIADKKDAIAKLNIKEAIIYDISLYSDILKQFIHQLSNKSQFTVSIPLPESFKNRNLVAYYIDESGKVEKHAVQQKDGMGAFETDHFSEYILGVEETESNVINPPTFDNIRDYAIALFAFGAIGAIVLTKKK